MMIILNLVISVILAIESNHVREELVNMSVTEEVTDLLKIQKI